jgi:CRP/FNR family transcriptional activator FtrB
MTDAHFDDLVRAAFLQRFPAHVVLIKEGELPDFLHVVVEGAVELFASRGAHETTIDILYPVTTFILAAVIQDQVYLKSARTLTSARILMVPAEAVRDVFDQDAVFARAIVGELAKRYRDVVRELKNQKLRTGIERLASWILAADRAGGGTGTVPFTYDKRTIASLLGMTPENLSRNLATLAADCICSEAREIRITDREKLQRISMPDPLIDREPTEATEAKSPFGGGAPDTTVGFRG